MSDQLIQQLHEQLAKIEANLSLLVRERSVKEWYSIPEVASILGRAEYTIRENCRQGRIVARKRPCGRGKGGEWLISHEELLRLKNEGLLPATSRIAVPQPNTPATAARITSG